MKMKFRIFLIFSLILDVLSFASVCYRNNKVSFARFFGRRFGVKYELKDSRGLDQARNFSRIEIFLFQRFAIAVAKELNSNTIPQDYCSLIEMINYLTFSTTNKIEVNDRSKRMLINLFPNGLLPVYKALFSSFPVLSGIMNTWVTHWTTTWLMGPSKVESYYDEAEKVFRKDQRVHVRKCRFLEQSGCIQVCLHACKVPTQRFFLEEMGLPVTLTPNFTDFSCKFDFNKHPIGIAEDISLTHPCLPLCPSVNNNQRS